MDQNGLSWTILPLFVFGFAVVAGGAVVVIFAVGAGFAATTGGGFGVVGARVVSTLAVGAGVVLSFAVGVAAGVSVVSFMTGGGGMRGVVSLVCAGCAMLVAGLLSSLPPIITFTPTPTKSSATTAPTPMKMPVFDFLTGMYSSDASAAATGARGRTC